ncbi:MAG: hypothetical protein CL844_03955 [Crocinitomicaceae bacterium]|nr:hypothetical protein [Crocinitomicaceae bacterium]|tara:strand:+ start:14407 stop:16179 length:1773 start_codon:yes stop_codon:yes gene_type:complete
MKNYIYLLLLGLVTLSSCGGGSNLNTSAVCDGDILIPFQEKKGKDWGFININGDVIIEPEFDYEPSYAVNGIAGIEKYSKKLDKRYYRFVKIQDGKAVESNKKWDLVGSFKEGLAPTRNDNQKVKFINENYETVFTVEAEEVSYFNEGYAAILNKKNKWGFIDKTGKETIKCQFDFIVHGFQDGHALACKYSKLGDKHFMIIDYTGSIILNLKDKYETVHSVWDGLIKVEDDDEWGFLDLEGNKVIKMNDDWDYVSDFTDGYASFREDGEWGLIDKTGQKILKARFENELIPIAGEMWYLDDNEWGLMDIEGNDILRPEFKGSRRMPFPFICGTTIVPDGDDYIFVDREGNEINQEEYENIANGLSRYIDGKAWDMTFESEYFDLSSVRSLISKDFLNIKNAEKFVASFDFNPELIWSDRYRSYKEVGRDRYKFYVNKKSYDFKSYKHSYKSRKPTKKDSKYPLDAPMGVESVSYKFYFDDYLGMSHEMSLDDARKYFDKKEKDKKLKLNKSARVKTARLNISLRDKGYGKASLFAKYLADSWKSSIKKVTEEKEGETTYRLKGDISGGTISIRTTGRSSLKVEIKYNLN